MALPMVRRILTRTAPPSPMYSHCAAPADYAAVNSVLVFSEFVNRVCSNVSIEEDGILEEDEEFALALNTTDPNTIVDPAQTTITIVSDAGECNSVVYT